MRLKNILLVVKDVERSKAFYRELFGLGVILDQEGKAILTEGLVLQDAAVWENVMKEAAVLRNHASELYFEEADMDGFIKKLDAYWQTHQELGEYALPLAEHPWGQKVVRFYDPDGHLIEVGTPV